MKQFLALMLLGVLTLAACTPTGEPIMDDEMMDDEMDETQMDDSMEMEDEMMEDEMMNDETANKGEFSRGKVMDFEQESYEAALAAGEDVVLDFYASWCPTCVKNEPNFDAAVEANGEVVAFKVDYDDSADLQKEFGVNKQSTIILIQEGNNSNYTTLAPAVRSQEEFTAFFVGDDTEITEESGIKDSVVRGKVMDYDEETYQAALAAGDTVVLDFYADWCTTCKSNEPHFDEAVESNEDIVAFKVNYDNESELKKEFGINKQSTLVLIKGGDLSGFTTLGPGLFELEDFTAFLQS